MQKFFSLSSLKAILSPFLDKIDSLEHVDRKGFVKYFFNTGWMFIARIILMAINFFVGAYLARYLEPSAYGMYNYVVSFVGLFAFISGFGIDAILGREILLHPEKRKDILGASVYIHLVTSVIAVILINAVSLMTEQGPRGHVLIALFSLTFLFHASGVFPIVFESEVLAKKNAVIQVGTAILSALMKCVGFFFGFGLMWFVSLFVFDIFVTTVWYFIEFRKYGWAISKTLDVSIAKRLILDSLPFMLSIIAASIYFKIDQVMITHMLGVERTGVYSVAVRLTEAWYFIPGLICASVFPAIVNAKKVSREMYLSRVKSLIVFMMILGSLIAIPLYLVAPYLISTLFGPLYMDAVPSFQVYVWSSLASFVMPAIATYVTTENKGGMLLLSTTIGAIVNITLNYYLIPIYGIRGSALATLISYTIPTLLLLALFFRNHNKG